VPETDAAALNAALDAAQRAAPTWRAVPASERGALLLEVARRLHTQAAEIAEVETRNTGKPLADTRREEQRAAACFEYYGGYADKVLGTVIGVPGPFHTRLWQRGRHGRSELHLDQAYGCQRHPECPLPIGRTDHRATDCRVPGVPSRACPRGAANGTVLATDVCVGPMTKVSMMSTDYTGPAKGQIVAGIDRALDILIHLGEADTPTLGVTEIAANLGLSKAVVHRTLTSCVAKGFITFHPTTRRYSLGPRIVGLALGYLDRIDVRAEARPVLQKLSAATDETATLSIRSGWSRVYVDQVTPHRDVKMIVQLGGAFPLHAGASSKAFLAFMSAQEQAQYLAAQPLTKLTDKTISHKQELLIELAHIAEVGYAVSFGERDPSAGSVAAPVFGPNGPLAVISIAGPVERFRPEVDRFAGLLLDAVAELSAQVGGVRQPPAQATQ
jgi:DNA-binding IclR family transcriptional regulator